MRSEVKDIRYDRTTQNTHNDKDRHTHPIYEDRHYTNTYPPYWNIRPILPFMIGQISNVDKLAKLRRCASRVGSFRSKKFGPN